MRACISAATATALVLLGACVVEDAYGPEGEIEQQEAWDQPLTGDGLTATLTYGSDWGTGYCADVKIQNTGTTATATWQVATNMNGSSVANAWNAVTRMSGSQLIATPADHNASLAPGASTSFGFCATASGPTQRAALANVTAGGSGSSASSSSASSSSASSGAGGSGGASSASSSSASSGAGGSGSASSSSSASSGAGGSGGGSGGAGGSGGSGGAAPSGHYQMEDLDRGVVAIKVSSGVYVGWRMFGYEYDPTTPSAISYDVYRNGTRIANVTNSTNYLDTAGATSSTYAIKAVVGGAAQAASPAVATWGQNYLRIPLEKPANGTTPSRCDNAGESYSYSANDASTGDVDGDGQYEILLKWDPSNAKDNSQAGCTGPVYLDAYKLDGRRLWRIDLGRNIRAGAHYTQFVVYDFDGDGSAEVAVKTAPGTRDGTGATLRRGPAASDDDAADYRNAAGYVLSGPEYLTVFAGNNGAELATVAFDVPRGTVSSWGDSYGNRVDRFLASAAFVSDLGRGQDASGRPAILMARGYYTRATITAWSFRDGSLSQIWKADSNANTAYTGQGAHSMVVADVDADGAQEVIYGASTIDSNGTRKCSTALGHGDALHVSDFVLSRPGLEVFMPHEDGSKPTFDLHDANSCAILEQGPVTGADTGRGVAGDVLASNAGAEMWTNSTGGLLSATSGSNVGSQPASANFLIWWDADELRELQNNTSITKYGGGSLLSCSQCASNNGTKSTPALTADLLGDWREEIVWRESDSSALRLYATTNVTARRIYTLMHDPQYRMQITSEQTAYNQPPHPSFHIGGGMAAPPRPDIHVR